MEKSLVTKVILAASLVAFGVETNLHAIQAEMGHALPSGAVWNVASTTGSTSWISSHLTAYPSAMTETVYVGVTDQHLLKQGGAVHDWPALLCTPRRR